MNNLRIHAGRGPALRPFRVLASARVVAQLESGLIAALLFGTAALVTPLLGIPAVVF
jgi:hypothetical protein